MQTTALQLTCKCVCWQRRTLQNNLTRSFFLSYFFNVIAGSVLEYSPGLYEITLRCGTFNQSDSLQHTLFYLLNLCPRFSSGSLHRFPLISNASFISLSWCHECRSLCVDVFCIKKWRIKTGQLKLDLILSASSASDPKKKNILFFVFHFL